MVEVLFRRSTHNPDGTPRAIADGSTVEGPVMGLGVHALDSSEFHSFSSFVQQHIEYAYQFPESPVPPVSDLLRDLATLVDADLVEVKVNP